MGRCCDVPGPAQEGLAWLRAGHSWQFHTLGWYLLGSAGPAVSPWAHPRLYLLGSSVPVCPN